MAKIRILSEQVANMIAAGEVIERPSSVVKELIENAIDASSSEIEVKIIGGGIKSIEVSDNGCGMEKDDIELAFTRHATSKIFTSSDLFNIKTLGFRGEALPSIASVSSMKLSSSTGNNVGYEATITNSKISDIKPFMQRKGTIIKVSDLFFNTPARLKHLKSENVETSYILDVVNKLALGYPNIKFRVYSEGKLVFKTSGRNNLLEVISDVYGYNTSKNMIEVNFKNDEFSVSGYISNLSITKASRKYMTYLINNRNVKMNYLTNAIKDAYLNYLEMDKFPIVVLNIEVDHKLVDINVHPSKNEVRLSDEFSLCKLVKENIRLKLANSDLIKRVITKKDYAQEELNLEVDYQPNNVNPSNISPSLNVLNDNYQEKLVEQKEEVKGIDSLFRIVGQIHKTYIVIETKEGFYLVDQHAAMERVNFEKYQKLFTSEINTIPLLIKKIVELNYKDIAYLKDKLDLFNEVGFEVEIFGNNALRVNKVPTWMIGLDVESIVNDVVEQILENKNIDLVKLRNHTIATVACKASLKANKTLDNNEMTELINNLFKCENPHTCPHGRPTLIFYSNYELEKLFKRA